MKIIFSKTVNLYFWELINILHQKNYFGFHESAREYVLSLRRELESTIHIKQKREAPKRFSRYGNDLYYVAFPKNKRTTWYFFFTLHPGDVYVIRYITNNHVAGHLLDNN